MRQSFFLLFFLGLVFLASCAKVPVQKACTEEAKLCPDGSAVGRSGPSCEFAACPNVKEGVDMAENLSFCNADTDCVCGGIDRKSGNCFVGNKEYAKNDVDFTKDCPDFCTGIAGHLETKCVAHACKTVPRPGWNQQVNQSQVQEASLASAHWECEDGSWKEAPEQCFANTCLSNGDCQLIGVKGACGPSMMVAPKSMHKPPIFYANKCGSQTCAQVDIQCVEPELMPLVKNAVCENNKCVALKGPDCKTDTDCVKNACCHATGCIKGPAKPCTVMCTQECRPDTLDCGGSCGCMNGQCVGKFAQIE